eukprot:Rhum_TRINITY_DN15024_c15_g1::Rhum_TRINITY_DN15024_c15_g1_i1::g.133878::m.133878
MAVLNTAAFNNVRLTVGIRASASCGVAKGNKLLLVPTRFAEVAAVCRRRRREGRRLAAGSQGHHIPCGPHEYENTQHAAHDHPRRRASPGAALCSRPVGQPRRCQGREGGDDVRASTAVRGEQPLPLARRSRLRFEPPPRGRRRRRVRGVDREAGVDTCAAAGLQTLQVSRVLRAQHGGTPHTKHGSLRGPRPCRRRRRVPHVVPLLRHDDRLRPRRRRRTGRRHHAAVGRRRRQRTHHLQQHAAVPAVPTRRDRTLQRVQQTLRVPLRIPLDPRPVSVVRQLELRPDALAERRHALERLVAAAVGRQAAPPHDAPDALQRAAEVPPRLRPLLRLVTLLRARLRTGEAAVHAAAPAALVAVFVRQRRRPPRGTRVVQLHLRRTERAALRAAPRALLRCGVGGAGAGDAGVRRDASCVGPAAHRLRRAAEELAACSLVAGEAWGGCAPAVVPRLAARALHAVACAAVRLPLRHEHLA